MEDKEIIEGLAHCFNMAEYSDCNECPYRGTKGKRCTQALYDDVLDLINRQQEKVETLRDVITATRTERTVYKKLLETARAEATREFARRLKAHIEWATEPVDDCDIDSIVAEMVGAE